MTTAHPSTRPENPALDTDETPAESPYPNASVRRSGSWRPRQVTEAEIQKLIAERTSPAVKSALESLQQSVLTAGGPVKRTRKRA
jgi:hypothetical protein